MISGGIVAHNDEQGVERSLRSLLDQELPAGVSWSRIWLVASGCTDRTVEIAQAVAREDVRVRVVVDSERRGKAVAIQEVLRRSEGDAVVLLNSDAVAHPGAVAALLEYATGKRAPYAVMARPVVRESAAGPWADTMRWMWEMHHELHTEFLSDGTGAHLSDELLLLSLPVGTGLGEGIINDGSYFAVWLSQHQGGCWYAAQSRVTIEVPETVADHLTQRRRIHVGNGQVRRALGRSPTTLPRYFLAEPRRAVRAIGAMVRRPSGIRHFLRVTFWELVARGFALWDRLPPARDHVHWMRIRSSDASPTPTRVERPVRSPGTDVDGRLTSLLSVASHFSTGVPLDHLAQLLPDPAPSSGADLADWLTERPHLARVEDGRAFSPASHPSLDGDRSRLGAEYRRAAEQLLGGPLRFAKRWVRCVALTGSAAYGEPRPGDDLDLLVVTRTGALWWFLLATYIALRFRRGAKSVPVPCFNYVMDDSSAPELFSRGRGFLFARESLTAQALYGEPYYRGLLAGSPWMGGEIPRLYAIRSQSPGGCAPSRAPVLVRTANLAAYPLLASYLHLVGLWRNARQRRWPAWEGQFSTITGLHRLAFVSRRFEELRSRYETRRGSHANPEVSGGPSRLPTAR